MGYVRLSTHGLPVALGQDEDRPPVTLVLNKIDKASEMRWVLWRKGGCSEEAGKPPKPPCANLKTWFLYGKPRLFGGCSCVFQAVFHFVSRLLGGKSKKINGAMRW